MYFIPLNNTIHFANLIYQFCIETGNMSCQGAVGLRFRVYDRVMCFVNCHFAAHLDAVSRRNADFDHVYRTMSFYRPTNLINAVAGTSLFLSFSAHLP